jgi:hypothetical protein
MPDSKSDLPLFFQNARKPWVRIIWATQAMGKP